MMVNGVALSTMIGGGWGGGAVPNATGMAEFAIDVSGVDAQAATGGVRINFIPRDGGNKPAGTIFGGYTTEGFASDNFTGSDVQSRGLAAPPRIKGNGDFNPGFGGPIVRDKFWFFVSGRYLYADNYVPGMFYNANANDVTALPVREHRRAGHHPSGPDDVPGPGHVPDEPEEQVRLHLRPRGAVQLSEPDLGDGHARGLGRPAIPAAAFHPDGLEQPAEQPGAARGERDSPCGAMGRHAPPDGQGRQHRCHRPRHGSGDRQPVAGHRRQLELPGVCRRGRTSTTPGTGTSITGPRCPTSRVRTTSRSASTTPTAITRTPATPIRRRRTPTPLRTVCRRSSPIGSRRGRSR